MVLESTLCCPATFHRSDTLQGVQGLGNRLTAKSDNIFKQPACQRGDQFPYLVLQRPISQHKNLE